MIQLARPHISDDDLAAVERVLKSRWLSAGMEVQKFEEEVAQYVRQQHAVAVSSGSTALSLALALHGIGPGDDVIIPSFCYLAGAHCIALAGAHPVFVDVDGDSWNIHAEQIAAALSPRTRAVVVVDQFGVPADFEAIQASLAGHDHVVLIEDAACALGAADNDTPCGGGNDRVTCFSFHPRKMITTGEGGMITTSDADQAHQLRKLRNHGRSDSGAFEISAGNYRLSELAAALGRSQLRRLDWIIEYRKTLAQRYRSLLGDDPRWQLQRQPPPGRGRAVDQCFAICLQETDRRNAVLHTLRSRGIEASIATYAAHLEEPYRQSAKLELPESTRLARGGIALPLHCDLSVDDVDLVVETLRQTLT